MLFALTVFSASSAVPAFVCVIGLIYRIKSEERRLQRLWFVAVFCSGPGWLPVPVSGFYVGVAVSGIPELLAALNAEKKGVRRPYLRLHGVMYPLEL